MGYGGARANSGRKPGPRQKNPGLAPLYSRVTSREALQELAREYSGEAVMIAVGLMRNEEAKDEVRLNAAKEVVDRAWGKAAPVLEIPGAGGLIVHIVKFGDSLEEDEPKAIEHE